MSKIPAQTENPNGLHQRYFIQKLVPKTEEELEVEWEKGRHMTGNNPIKVNKQKLVPVDEGSEYFVMRLDEGGSDINHIKACRIGVHAYADAIEPFIPELAKDLRERYPLL